MRELDLFSEYLTKERQRHQHAALKMLLEDKPDQAANEAWVGEAIGYLIKDLQLLDQDTGEFVKRFLR